MNGMIRTRFFARAWQSGLAAVLLLAASGVARATQATLTGDSFVSTARPSVNFGALSNLYVGNGNTALLQFDLSSLPAGTTSAQIVSAQLRVFVNRVYSAGTLEMLPVQSAWTELGVTDSSAPTLGPNSGSLNVAQGDAFYTIDMTTVVQGWVAAPSTNFGVALQGAAGASLVLDSKENDSTGHAAELDITLAGPVGPQGPQGPIGLTGATGSQGPAGPQGPPISFQGAYDVSIPYVLGDAVSYTDGSSYISLQSNNIGNLPGSSPTFWAVLAKAGATGPQGPQGPTGPQGPQGATGPQGPQGATGATGPQGATGATGATGPPVSFLGNWVSSQAYTVGQAVFCAACSANGSSYIALAANTNVDPPTDVAGSGGHWALLAEQGAQGVQGPQGPVGSTGATGPAGAAATVTVGTTTTGAPGTSASVTNSGTSSAAVLNFTIPQGASGGGVNAYDTHVEFQNPTAAGVEYQSPVQNVDVTYNSSSPLTTYGGYGTFTVFPVNCTMKALNVAVSNASSLGGVGSDTTTITVFHNGSATSMTCSVTTNGNSLACQDTTHTFAVSAGDQIGLLFNQTSRTPANQIDVGLICE